MNNLKSAVMDAISAPSAGSTFNKMAADVVLAEQQAAMTRAIIRGIEQRIAAVRRAEREAKKIQATDAAIAATLSDHAVPQATPAPVAEEVNNV